MKPLMDELTFRSYAHQRTMFPDVQPERWAAIFQNVPAMEERLLKTFIAKVMEEIEVADQATGSAPVKDSLQVGDGDEANGIPSSPLQNCTLEEFATEVKVCGCEGQQGQRESCVVANATCPCFHNEASLHAYNPRAIILPVPLGREVSGVAEGCDEQMRASHTEQGQYLTANGGMNQFARSCNKSEIPASPADQIFSYFPLAEIVEKVFKQRSFLCN